MFRKLLLYIILPIFVILLLYLFYGPLAPWMPLVIGYDILNYNQVEVVITPANKSQLSDINFNEMIDELKRFHGLELPSNVRVFILDEHKEMRRFVPWHTTPGPVGFEIPTGDVIYIICNEVKQKGYNIENVIKHELSHCILHQQMCILDTGKLQNWLREGIAVYYGGPKYKLQDKVKEEIKNIDLNIDPLSDLLFTELNEKNHVLNYALFGELIGFIIKEYGLTNFQKFLLSWLKNSNRISEIFLQHYNMSLIEIVSNFRNKMLESL